MKRLRALAVFSDRGCQCAIELTMQEEFAVLGVEANGVGRQHIGGEVRREAEHVLGPLCSGLGRGFAFRRGLAMNFHRVSTHVSPIASEIACRGGSSWPLEIASSTR